MSIITFWNNGNKETGKTLSLAAVCTSIAIEHNYKILVISTGYKEDTLTRCFWEERKVKKNLGVFGPNTSTGIEDGMVGLVKVMNSNKLRAEDIVNYSKPVFKERLEILTAFHGKREEYDESIKESYLDIITMANTYYDLVFVDLSPDLGEEICNEILQKSNLIVASLCQRRSTIDEFQELREQVPMFKSKKTLILVGKYDRYSKYTIKNISSYLGERNKISVIPYNTLFFEATEEAGVIDLFFRLRKVGSDDRNGAFIEEVKRTSDNIIYRIQDLAMKM